MKVTLVHNPNLDFKNGIGIAEVLGLIRNAGHRVRYQSVKVNGWEKALSKSADLVATAGGDGTVGKVVRRLVGQQVPIAVLPLGTANNIAQTLQLASVPLERLIASWHNGRLRKLNAARADGPWGARVFIEAMGCGFLAAAMAKHAAAEAEQSAHLRQRKKELSYVLKRLLERLPEYPPTHFEISVDKQEMSGEYIMVEVMNISHVGPRLQLAPQADPTDGFLDVVLLPERDRKKLDEYFRACLEGEALAPNLTVRKVKDLQLRAKDADAHVDDMPWSGKGCPDSRIPFSTEVHLDRHTVPFLVPE
jgi:diacylglycerol kinase family enzyme